jgi:hypothetical protein
LEIRHETQHEIGGWAQVFGVTDTEVNEPGPAVNDEALGVLEAEILDTVEREDIGVGGPGREPSDRSTVDGLRGLFIARVPGDDQAGQAMPQLPWRQHRAAPPLWAAGLRIVLVSRCFTPPTGCSTIRVIDTTAWSRRLADRCGTEVVRPVGSPPAPVFAAREIP